MASQMGRSPCSDFQQMLFTPFSWKEKASAHQSVLETNVRTFIFMTFAPENNPSCIFHQPPWQKVEKENKQDQHFMSHTFTRIPGINYHVPDARPDSTIHPLSTPLNHTFCLQHCKKMNKKKTNAVELSYSRMQKLGNSSLLEFYP